MKKTLLLALCVLSFTACAKEEPKITKFVCQTQPEQALKIIDKPIAFSQARIDMTKQYIKDHYGKTVDDIIIEPKIILLHWTAEMDFDASFKRLQPEKLLTDRKDIAAASALNVSAQFLVARDGTIYRLMPENWMARHVIGLNYYSIGIENVGGKGNKVDDLTPAQLSSNIALVKYLKAKYPSIKYLIGHHEYTNMEQTPLWLEKDKGYRTIKADPGDAFVKKVYEQTKDMGLIRAPKGHK